MKEPVQEVRRTAMEPDDTALVAAARAGDRAAFGRLVGRHRDMVVTLCGRMLGDDAQQAEDATQEAVVAAMINLERLRRPESFGSWLAGIALNVCRRWLRGRTPPPAWQARERPDPAPSPVQLAENAHLAVLVRRAVEALPPGQRVAAVHFYLDGLTYAELAGALEISVGAVKTRLHRARNTLRDELRGVWEEWIMSDETTMVAMRAAGVHRLAAEGDRPDQHVLLLEEAGGSRRLPIWIGPFEATALAYALEALQLPRPSPYDLMTGLLTAADARVAEVQVVRLAEGTFYASVLLDGSAPIDARPSDACNLALLTGAPISVAAAILDDEQREQRTGELERRVTASTADIVAERQAEWAETLNVSCP